MPQATYHGPRWSLRIAETGTRLLRDEVTEVSASEVDILSDSSEDVTVSDESVPNKSAPKAEWIAYRVAGGMDPDEAEAATKEELISGG